ncbi:BA14K family protein [Rhodoligotrophos defluvii]|uniref:BA14K family protein n=1 Tax=Rhodoligotrophos defluvii TaxID=2561934 RepID=UPI001484EDC0|nr:BA14K family protein [Rhodoligotrophos defluvii]
MKNAMLGLAGAMVIGLTALAPNAASAASPISSIAMADSMRQATGLETTQVRDRFWGGGGWRGGWGRGWRHGGWGGWRGGWGPGWRHGWRHRGWGWGPGPAIGLGLGLGLGAAALATAPLYGGGYYGYGYRPAYVYGGLRPWSPAWYRYCSSRYRSFDPSTGYFRTHSGRLKFCRG